MGNKMAYIDQNGRLKIPFCTSLEYELLMQELDRQLTEIHETVAKLKNFELCMEITIRSEI